MRTPPATAAPALDERLSYRLGVAGRLLRTWADAELAALGVAARRSACCCACRGGRADPGRARPPQRVEAPTMCRMVDRLVRDGLVERRADPADRRATRVSSPAGRGRRRGGAASASLEDRAFAEPRPRAAAAGELLGRVIGGLAPGAPHEPRRAASPRLTLAGLVTAAMAFALMQTFLIPALPTLQEDLHTSGTWVTWTVTTYLLTGSVATPLIGQLGDQHGKVSMMVVSLRVFLVGSLGAIVAPGTWLADRFRAIQGVGGAVFPLSFAIIRDEFPPERQSVAMGLVSAVLGVGGGVGIVASGLIVDNLSWRWLFVVSAAVVAARAGAGVALRAGVARPGALARRHPGAPSLSGASSPAGGTDRGPAPGLGIPRRSSASSPAPRSCSWCGASWSCACADPMVDMRMLARRVVLFTNLTAMLSGFALYMTWVILPAFFQLPRGLPRLWRSWPTTASAPP